MDQLLDLDCNHRAIELSWAISQLPLLKSSVLIHTEVPQVSGSVSSAAQQREAKLEKLKKEKIHFEL